MQQLCDGPVACRRYFWKDLGGLNFTRSAYARRPVSGRPASSVVETKLKMGGST